VPYVEVGELSMYYEEQGAPDGPPLVLLHGAGGTIDDPVGGWAGLVPSFGESHRLVLVEHRGHGRTGNPAGFMTFEQIADDVAALLEGLGMSPVHVAGISDGGVVALDLALQMSPDHPWLREHPEWFQHRPDGTLKYAENPPKRYQDIHNLDWDTHDRKRLWEAIREVVEHWCGLGVTVFRVDNPHTKPIPFWEWLIRGVRSRYPDTVFLSEAFTRPAPMTLLAKAGFSQSYTYFTWKNTKAELVELVEQLRSWSDFLRPNLWPNTPDILHATLQTGGRPAFELRLLLAATLSPSYGIYSGYEACENVPVRAGSEEYLDSEKYELRERRLDGQLLPLVKRLNELRRAHPALTGAGVERLTWLETETDHLLGFARSLGDDTVLVVVNLDPFAVHDGVCVVPPELGLPERFDVVDGLTGETYDWGGRNYVRLGPGKAHVLEVQRQ